MEQLAQESPLRQRIKTLLRLIDDDSPVVREALAREFVSLGPRLETELAALGDILSPLDRLLVEGLLSSARRQSLQKSWLACLRLTDDKEKLEAALSCLSDFQAESPVAALKDLLDSLAHEFLQTTLRRDAMGLADFLFKVKGLRGAVTDTVHPGRSSLVQTIQKKQGLPISLACVYMLVGRRLGLTIEGCNFPGHFLAKIPAGGKAVLVDCFNGGNLIEEEAILRANKGMPRALEEILSTPVDAFAILSRVLANLINAYDKTGQAENSRFMMELLHSLDRYKGTE